MNTIERAIRNNPVLAALVILTVGASVATAIVALVSPSLWPVLTQVLSGIALALIGIYLYVSRQDETSATPFNLPHVIGIQITWGMKRHSLVWMTA